jgi:hypothetical protein
LRYAQVAPAEADVSGAGSLAFEARGCRSGESRTEGTRRDGRCGVPGGHRGPPWPLARHRAGLRGPSVGRANRGCPRSRASGSCLPALPWVSRARRGPTTALRHRSDTLTILQESPGSLCRPASARQLPPRPITRPGFGPECLPGQLGTRSVLVVSHHLDGLLRAPHRSESDAGPASGRTRSQVYCNLLPTGVRRVSTMGDSGRRTSLPGVETTPPRPRDAFTPPEDSLASSRTVSPPPLPP